MSIRTWIIVERARRAEGVFSGEVAVGGGGGERVVVSDGISRGGVQVREGIQQEQDEDLEKEEREGALIMLQCRFKKVDFKHDLYFMMFTMLVLEVLEKLPLANRIGERPNAKTILSDRDRLIQYDH